MKNLLCICCCFFVSGFLSAQECSVIAHSHNDYEHKQPLYDAQSFKFRSVEADVYSIDDSLFVAHDFDKISAGRTLRSLYLEPLKEQIEKNNGSVYGDGKEFILLIDIKDDSIRTYELLDKILEEYKACLCVIENGEKQIGPIMPVVSGNRPFKYMKNQQVRYAGYDGRIDNLGSGIPATLMPVVSDDWNSYFKWDGIGEMPKAEKKKLQELAAKSKTKGYLLRFWATPDQTLEQRRAVWTELKKAGVGIIGTDHLTELNEFLKSVN